MDEKIVLYMKFNLFYLMLSICASVLDAVALYYSMSYGIKTFLLILLFLYLLQMPFSQFLVNRVICYENRKIYLRNLSIFIPFKISKTIIDLEDIIDINYRTNISSFASYFSIKFKKSGISYSYQYNFFTYESLDKLVEILKIKRPDLSYFQK